MKVPEWVDLVKTNVSKELAPYDEDWYFIRCASVARHIYVRSPVGVNTLTKIYGGEMNSDKRFAEAFLLPLLRRCVFGENRNAKATRGLQFYLLVLLRA